MLKLTREVRFAINRSHSPAVTPNGFGGVPAVQGLAHYFTLRVTLAGEVDPASSYLRNITEIDAQVRAHAIPAIDRIIRDHRFSHAEVLRVLGQELNPAWPGVAVANLELATSPYQSISIRPSEPEMIRLSQKFEFSAAHRLHNPELDEQKNRDTFGKCNNPHGHGHNYEVQVTLEGAPDDTGTLLPIPQLESIVDEHAISKLDHKHLNIEVDAFKTLNPSVENIARVIYQMLAPQLRFPHCKLAGVTVWETPKTWAEYAE